MSIIQSSYLPPDKFTNMSRTPHPPISFADLRFAMLIGDLSHKGRGKIQVLLAV